MESDKTGGGLEPGLKLAGTKCLLPRWLQEISQVTIVTAEDTGGGRGIHDQLLASNP